VNLDWKTVGAITVGVLVVGYVLKKQGLQAAKAVGSAVNPVSHSNIAYQGAEALTKAVAGPKATISDIFGANNYTP